MRIAVFMLLMMSTAIFASRCGRCINGHCMMTRGKLTCRCNKGYYGLGCDKMIPFKDINPSTDPVSSTLKILQIERQPVADHQEIEKTSATPFQSVRSEADVRKKQIEVEPITSSSTTSNPSAKSAQALKNGEGALPRDDDKKDSNPNTAKKKSTYRPLDVLGAASDYRNNKALINTKDQQITTDDIHVVASSTMTSSPTKTSLVQVEAEQNANQIIDFVGSSFVSTTTESSITINESYETSDEQNARIASSLATKKLFGHDDDNQTVDQIDGTKMDDQTTTTTVDEVVNKRTNDSIGDDNTDKQKEKNDEWTTGDWVALGVIVCLLGAGFLVKTKLISNCCKKGDNEADLEAPMTVEDGKESNSSASTSTITSVLDEDIYLTD